MDTNTFLLHKEQQRVQSEIAISLNAISHSTSCAEASRYSTIHVRSPFQSMRSFFGVNRFNLQAEEKVRQIIKKQLEIHSKMDSEQKAKNIGKLKTDWESLRGHFPALFRFAHQELGRIENAHVAQW